MTFSFIYRQAVKQFFVYFELHLSADAAPFTQFPGCCFYAVLSFSLFTRLFNTGGILSPPAVSVHVVVIAVALVSNRSAYISASIQVTDRTETILYSVSFC